MVEAVREHMRSAGIEPANFYYEKFAPAGTAEAAAVNAGTAETGSGA